MHVGAPQVAYKESITDSIKHETKFVKQSGGRGQYGYDSDATKIGGIRTKTEGSF